MVVDRDMLKLSGENIPRFVKLDGKNYFYFICLTKPVANLFGSSHKCHLMLSLFNIESNDIIQLDYACEQVLVKGETLYYGEAMNPRVTPEYEFLKSELARLPLVYHPTSEEQEMMSPSNASRKWQSDNAEVLDTLRNGKQEARFIITLYDSPLFSRSEVDMNSKVYTETCIYYTTYGGTVFGYNRVTKKFFIAYADERGAVPKTEINSDGTLHVAAVNIDFDFDPSTGKVTLN